jgi:hypothetical protein
MCRLNPKNKQDAYCYQLSDDIRVLRALAYNQDAIAYNKQVDIMIRRLNESRIKKQPINNKR